MSTIISSGEVSSGLIVNYSNPVYVSSGGSILETVVSGGSLYLMNGGYAEDTFMSRSGSMYVSFGGAAERTVLGENASGSYVSMYMSVFGSANSTTVNYGGSMTVSGAATVTNTEVNSYGRMYIYGGTVTNVVKNLGGNVSVYGGTLNGATINGWGNLTVMNGGVANNVVVSSGAQLAVYSGGHANDTVVSAMGSVYVSGATITNTEVDFRGYVSQYAGVVDGITVNMGGVFYAGLYWNGSAAGSAVNVIENGGVVSVGTYSSYGYPDSVKQFPVEFTPNTFSGLVYSSGGSGTVHSGTVALDITALNGGLTIYDGGIVNGMTITESTYVTYDSWTDEYGVEHVYSSTVHDFGTLSVLSGGTATNVVGEAHGDDWNHPFYFEIAAGTEIDGTFNGLDFVTANGTVENTSMNSLDLVFLPGATGTTLDAYDGKLTVSSGAQISGVILRGAGLDVLNGGVVDQVNTYPIPSSYIEYNSFDEESQEIEVETIKGAVVSVFHGGTVTNLYMDEEAFLYMQVLPGTVVHGVSGGQAVDVENAYFGGNTLGFTTVDVCSSSIYDAGSYVDIPGGTAADLIINNGATVKAGGGIAMNMTENGGALYVDEYDMEGITYTVASNTFSNENLHGDVTVHKNTIASDCILSNGGINIYSGGVVSNFYVYQKGMGMAMVMVDSGAIVTNLDMTRYSFPPVHGGHFELCCGAYVDTLRLQSDDFIYLYLDSDTVIRNGSVDGKPFSFENNVLSGFKLNEGMNNDMYLGEGATVLDCWFTYCPVDFGEGMYGSSVTIDRTYVYLNDGCVIEDLTVATGTYRGTYENNGSTYAQYDYGSATVYSGAVVSNVTVNNGGTLYVNSGGKVTGVMRFGSASTTVSCGSGAIIDFDLTDKSALYVARSNDWRFNGSYTAADPKYTITVDQQQGAGTYVLSNSTYFGDSKKFYVVDGTNGNEYGYFLGYFDYNWDSEHDTYQYYFVANYYGTTIEGLTLTMDAIQVERDDDIVDFDLVLKVESNYAAPKWVAAPTVTASNDKFTNEDVMMIAVPEKAEVVEYSLDGTTWQALDGHLTVSANGRYQFRSKDAEGTVSDVVTYTVSNIDKAAPTMTDPGSMTAEVDGATASLAWSEATDDFSGVAGYRLNFWTDPAEVIYIDTPWHNALLEDLVTGTWNWTVQTFDYAGNLTEAVAGTPFVVTNGYIPRLDLPNFLVGGFDGGTADQMATVAYVDNQGAFVTIYVDGAPWGNGLVLDPGWMLSGIGDFDADGQDDFLRINAEGFVVGELTQDNGTFAAQVLNFKSAGWDILGTGDFNGNGSDDVLIANPTGASDTVGLLGYWESGVTWTLINGYSAEWECIATGDFNNDGKCDMLWRNSFVGDDQQTYNAYCTWIVEDPVDWRMVSVANPAEWNFLCSGDFNADGCNDIAMINDVGVVGIWGVEDGWLSSWSILSAVDTSEWKLVGVGDFNGDGTDDIAWCSNISGLAGYWQIEDKTLAGWSNLANLA
ncbi:MAG: AIDA repeat-containing protein [Lentisphaeria bacterium]|nr:AIDA repeat-containing protein [Lentisphaeria bacterium]